MSCTHITRARPGEEDTGKIRLTARGRSWPGSHSRQQPGSTGEVRKYQLSGLPDASKTPNSDSYGGTHQSARTQVCQDVCYQMSRSTGSSHMASRAVAAPGTEGGEETGILVTASPAQYNSTFVLKLQSEFAAL